MMSRVLSLLALLCLPSAAAAQFFTVDQMTGTTGGELGFAYLTLEDTTEVTAQLLRGFVEISAAPTGDRWSGYLAFASGSADSSGTRSPDSIDSVLGIELGGAYTFALSPKSGATLRLGLTLPRGGDLNELAAAALSVPARLTDTVMLLPEVGALRLSMATHGQTGALVYRVEGGLDAPLLGDFAEDVDPVLRLNGAIGVMAGPTIIGLELVNLINPSNDGDASMVHTVSAGVRGDLGAIQPGVALTWPLDDDLSDAFGTILHLSVRVQLP